MNHQKVRASFTTAAFISAAAAFLTFACLHQETGSNGEMALWILAVPFEYTGKALRFLSLHSRSANMLAICLYTILCALPALYAVYRKKKNNGSAADWLLLLLSGYSFYLVYQFINPGLFLNRMPGSHVFTDAASSDLSAFLPVVQLTACFVFYSLLAAWLILNQSSRLHRTKTAPGIESDRSTSYGHMMRSLEKLLFACGILYLILVFYFQLIDRLQQQWMYQSIIPQQGSLLPWQSDGLSSVVTGSGDLNLIFLWLDYLLTVLPAAALVTVCYRSIVLLQALRLQSEGMQPFRAASGLYEASRIAVLTTVLCNLAWNLLQFAFSSRIQNVHIQLELSLLPLILSFASMLLSGGLKDMYELREDNEMII